MQKQLENQIEIKLIPINTHDQDVYRVLSALSVLDNVQNGLLGQSEFGAPPFLNAVHCGCLPLAFLSTSFLVRWPVVCPTSDLLIALALAIRHERLATRLNIAE